MPDDRSPSPLQSDQDILSFEVLVNGTAVQDTSFYFYSIEIEHGINAISKAKFIVLDGDPSAQSYELTSSDEFSPGTSVKINLGYRQNTETVFEGFVVATGVKVKEGQHSRMFVECVGTAYRLTVGRKTRYFYDMDDSDIISDVVSSYNSVSLGSVESTSNQHKCLVQYYSSDWDFIVMRAEANGMIVYTQENEVTVRKPQMVGSAALEVAFGRDIIKCDIQADARHQVKNVGAYSWDSATQEIVQGQSVESTLELNNQGESKVSGETMADFVHPLEYKIHTSGDKTQGELDKWANAQLLKSRLSRIRGVLTFQGNAGIRSDSVLSVDGLGDYFNGNAYVTKVVHRVEEGNWLTEAHIGSTSSWFAEASPNVTMQPASGLLPGIQNLYNGVVTKIHDDPDGEARIEVKIPVLSDSDNIWARMTSIYASDQVGVFFLPEVGDEVIIGFIQGDPRDPVILGKVHSQKYPPPYTADSDNTIKGIVTKNKLKLTFEDQNKNILIETPGGQKVLIKDEDSTITLQDSNNNKIVMDSGGITLESAKDITLKATGKISMNANQNIAFESKAGDVTSTGLNVKTDAKVMASVKGNMAELKGTATTEVKGAIVRIN